MNTSQTSISSQSSTSSESSMSDSNTTEEKNPNTTGSEYLFSVIPIPILFIFHLKKKRSS